MDNDNDHSENPEDWLTAEKLSELLSEVDHAITPSRNDMKAKNGKAARPRQHVYFPTSVFTDKDQYAALKSAIQRAFPFFDDNATDAARFFFGSDAAADAVIWNEGWLTIDEYVDDDLTVDTDATTPDDACCEKNTEQED